MLNIIDFDESEIYHQNPKILELLLKDQNTGGNICWATENYIDHGHMPQDEILLTDITEHNIIRPRVLKEKNIQRKRTRERAEVFTPSNIVEQQVSSVFNQKKDDIQWMMESVWIEITCGEAPYIVSRYDTTTGVIIPCSHRVGFLDRKFQLLNEIISDKQEWLEYAKQLYKKSYGYEFQGDSLLIARENLFLTVIDYYQDKFGLKSLPTDQSFKRNLEEIAEIISYNLIQADGLTGNIPFSEQKVIPKMVQLSLFDNYEESVDPQEAVFINWKNKKRYNLGGYKMKFDVVIGNPPYQMETAKKETKNGQKKTKNVFHYFQMQADKISKEYTCLIYPGLRWIHRTNKDVQSFGLNQINDPHLKKLIFYPDANSCFQGVSIGGGISIVIKDMHKVSHSFLYEYRSDTVQTTELSLPGERLVVLNPKDQIIINKVVSLMKNSNLSSYSNSMYINQKFFGIESNFVEKNPNRVHQLNEDEKLADDEIKVFTNDKSGKAGRAKWFIMKKEDVKKNSEYINKWKVIVSSANGGGQKRSNQLAVIDNKSIFGRARIALKMFDTPQEAYNCEKYLKSTIIRFLFLMSDESLSTLGEYVPDWPSYNNNSYINFSMDIDEQLKKYVILLTKNLIILKRQF